MRLLRRGVVRGGVRGFERVGMDEECVFVREGGRRCGRMVEDSNVG
jgi:hypothetical protein